MARGPVPHTFRQHTTHTKMHSPYSWVPGGFLLFRSSPPSLLFPCLFCRAPIGHEAPYYRMLDPRGRRQPLERIAPVSCTFKATTEYAAARTSRWSPSYLARIAANREAANGCNPREVGRTTSACPCNRTFSRGLEGTRHGASRSRSYPLPLGRASGSKALRDRSIGARQKKGRANLFFPFSLAVAWLSRQEEHFRLPDD